MELDKIFSAFDLKNTLLEELLVMLELGEFLGEFIDTVPGVPPAADEEVVGELSVLEKALGNLIFDYAITESELIKRAYDPTNPISPAELGKIKMQISVLRSRYEIVSTWRRASIKERFSPKVKPDTISIETRSQFRVVLVSRKKPKSECIIDLLGEIALAGLPKGNIRN